MFRESKSEIRSVVAHLKKIHLGLYPLPYIYVKPLFVVFANCHANQIKTKRGLSRNVLRIETSDNGNVIFFSFSYSIFYNIVN
jgi:hypothetical protein